MQANASLQKFIALAPLLEALHLRKSVFLLSLETQASSLTCPLCRHSSDPGAFVSLLEEVTPSSAEAWTIPDGAPLHGGAGVLCHGEP